MFPSQRTSRVREVDVREVVASVGARYSRAALASLPPALLLTDANRMLALSRTKGYLMARTGQYPCGVIQVGDGHRVVTTDLFRLLEVDDTGIRRTFAELPPAVPLPVANTLLSLCRTTGYRLARTGQYPCAVLRLGKEYRVRKNELQRLLRVADLSSGRAVA
ncbi:hypothetical protein ACI1MP_10725 [Kitasatospora griseola]|uniref:hypothetical protein n=1 Tax=Kitasatospora griseola TaxID=2064 RepID=UPI0038560DB8